MILDSLRNAIMITAFVLCMMLLIEYLTVLTKGRWSLKFYRSRWLQIILAAILGILPGCLGTYTVVSLYTHRIMNFAALITACIATFGDEAFVMFSMIPEAAVRLSLIIFIISIAVGLVINFLFRDKQLIETQKGHFEVHHDEPEISFYHPGLILNNLKQITFEKTILLISLALVILGIISGQIGDHHNEEMISIYSHAHKWNWVTITSLITSLSAFFVVATVPSHFLQEHLWEHIIKKHLVRIFSWTFAAILIIHLGSHYLNIGQWVQSNPLTVLLIACLIGLIPESGPHMVFIPLFAEGVIPFSVLLANSIVQDGHGSLPLLAESKKSFFLMKSITFIISILVGLAGYFIGF